MSDIPALQLPPHVQVMPEEERRLRKAWLKRKFTSFDYHEELVKAHERWRSVLRKALARAQHDESPGRPQSGHATIADEARSFARSIMPIIDKKPRPGDYKREDWHSYSAVGLFRSIPDYSRYLLSEGDMLGWMNEDEHRELGRYWEPMGQMATNIRRTVDDTWGRNTDDILLDEQYTGPIDWPANWRDDVRDLVTASSERLRCEANHPCPREGWWFTPAKPSSRRHFQQGEVMPAFKTDYGLTIWQWDERQTN